MASNEEGLASQGVPPHEVHGGHCAQSSNDLAKGETTEEDR